jgi:hypothetical protein
MEAGAMSSPLRAEDRDKYDEYLKMGLPPYGTG